MSNSPRIARPTPRPHSLLSRPARLLAVLACLCLLVTAGCADTRSKYFGEPVQQQSVSDMPISQARAETLTLLINIYNMLSDKYDVGEWTPRTTADQASLSARIDCPEGYISERYTLATSTVPLTEENWEQALQDVYELATPYGFQAPEPYVHSKGNAAILVNPDNGATVLLKYEGATAVIVDTGCAQGVGFDDWPDGTEPIPEYLRGSGRGTWATIEPEEWPTTTPTPVTEETTP
ncbi:LppA family lipoprotein [Actinobaculum sp. 352]|uniref:LppA family lipoprotein n=1 Tax=Actinobaculum sp. 352 TaxID=2490946 RepID=UPI0013DFE541|nr:LppA family lipoprotein [Actinobaculum sp. 352]